MESDRTSNNTQSDGARNGLPRARPLHGRTSGPTRRSTKGQWTTEEDEILRMAVQRFKGKNWKKIAECFKDRTDVQCLHRWQKVLNPDLVKGPWSKEEDEIIIEMVKKYGPKKWSTIAQHLPGRIGKQCRERWHNHLNPNINKEAWTQDEELALIRAHQIYGNKWAELTKYLPGRTDNSIKNHWNSSVKKKLDMYLASGLLSQFQGLPLVSHPNAASCSSKAQQSSEDDSDVKGGVEMEEASECSQSSNVATMSQSTNNIVAHPRAAEDTSTISCSEGYLPAFQEDTFGVPEIPCELGEKFPENDFPIDWGSFVGKDWQFNPNEVPNMPLLDMGQESGMFLTSLGGHDNNEALPPQESFMVNMVYPEGDLGGCCPSENVIRDIEGPSDSLLLHSPNIQISDYMPYELLANAFTQSLPCSTQLPPADGTQHVFGINPNQFSYSHENAEQVGFIYPKDSEYSPCENKSNEVKESPKLVPANDFVLAPSNDTECSSSKDNDSKTDEQKDSGTLFYEPPRFPSLDIPFFSCDIQPGSDMNQEYSPLGIRQLMMSSMTPFKLWDSPSRDDSPHAVLKTAAKTFTGTPSILKKRHRDLVSPLSERRGEKKLDSCVKQESFSNLTNDFSRLEVMFDECIDKNGSLSPNKINVEAFCAEKENANPVCEQTENDSNKCVVMSESEISPMEINGSECLNKITEKAVVTDVRTLGQSNDAIETAKEFSGILVEHDSNDMIFFSPDRFGVKTDRGVGLSARALANQCSRRVDNMSKLGAVVSSAAESSFSVLCSPLLLPNKDGTNLVMSTSLQSSSPSKKKIGSSVKGEGSENNSIFIETPFKRSLESPSSWKSPWFMSGFVPGPRVDTDITIEDIGYFVSPGDRSYDALGLMKQLGEQTAEAFADAQNVLGDETPETIMKGKSIVNPEEDKENNCSPSSPKDHSVSASNFMERRALDFSECETPGKEKTMSLPSCSSYLLKNCR